MKWEYKIISAFILMAEEDINNLGLEGWELVSVVWPANGSPFHYFKRLIKEQ